MGYRRVRGVADLALATSQLSLTLTPLTYAAGIARSWAAYADLFLQHWGIHLPHWIVTTEIMGQSCSLLASMLVLACTFILLAGVHVRWTMHRARTGAGAYADMWLVCCGCEACRSPPSSTPQ